MPQTQLMTKRIAIEQRGVRGWFFKCWYNDGQLRTEWGEDEIPRQMQLVRNVLHSGGVPFRAVVVDATAENIKQYERKI